MLDFWSTNPSEIISSLVLLILIKAIIENIRAFQLDLRMENGDLVTYPNNLILQQPVTLVEKDAINEMDEL